MLKSWFSGIILKLLTIKTLRMNWIVLNCFCGMADHTFALLNLVLNKVFQCLEENGWY